MILFTRMMKIFVLILISTTIIQADKNKDPLAKPPHKPAKVHTAKEKDPHSLHKDPHNVHGIYETVQSGLSILSDVGGVIETLYYDIVTGTDRSQETLYYDILTDADRNQETLYYDIVTDTDGSQERLYYEITTAADGSRETLYDAYDITTAANGIQETSYYAYVFVPTKTDSSGDLLGSFSTAYVFIPTETDSSGDLFGYYSTYNSTPFSRSSTISGTIPSSNKLSNSTKSLLMIIFLTVLFII